MAKFKCELCKTEKTGEPKIFYDWSVCAPCRDWLMAIAKSMVEGESDG